jgi:GntR family histidine utilization transcriptional repressor
MIGQVPETPSPLYERVKQYIQDGIRRGHWGVGARLPSEHELRRTLSVSRMTVNRALRELTDAGVITRVQGVGTFVAAARSQSPLLEIVDIADDITARGHQHSLRLVKLESVRPTETLAAAFGLRTTATLFHSVVVHLENGLAVQLEERYVSPFFAPHYLEQDFARETTTHYLRGIAPATEVEQQVTGVRADPRTCKLLAIDGEEACIRLLRKTWVGSQVATVNYFTYPGSRYALGSRYRVQDRGNLTSI